VRGGDKVFHWSGGGGVKSSQWQRVPLSSGRREPLS
jgi:hypothetical protein